MLKVNRTSTFNANRQGRKAPKNQGGFLGGLGYIGASALAGIGGIAEGAIDIVGALGADLTGNHEAAENMFKNNVVGDWYADVKADYNPGGAMSFVGDVTHGIGQSSVLFIPYAGVPLFYAGIGAQGVSSAAAKTGEVGIKEVAYGATSAAIEGLVDKALGGTATAIGNVVKGVGKGASRAGKTIFKATTDATRKGLAKTVFSSAAGEFGEEFISEYADTFLQRLYQIDPNASTSLKDAIYAGAVGAVSGAFSTSVATVPKSINYHSKGESIIKRGNSQTLVNTATKVADKLAAKGTSFKDAAEWVTALRGQVDAYNDLVKNGKGESASAKTILGEMQAYLYFAETKAAHAGITDRIMNASEEDRAALAEYINMTVKESDRPKTYTAEDVKKNTDEIASQLAIMEFAGIALNYDAIRSDEEYEQEIASVIAEERNKGAAEGQSGTPVPTNDGTEMSPEFAAAAARAETVAQTVDETVAPAVAQTVDKTVAEAPQRKMLKVDRKRGVPIAGETVFVENAETAPRGKTEYVENIYEDGSQPLPNLGVPTANPNTYPSVEELDRMGREVRYRLTPDGREVLPDSGAPEPAAYTYPSVPKQVIGEISDADRAAARARTEAAARFEEENAEQNFGETAGASPRPTSETKNEAEKKSSERSEKSSERANKAAESANDMSKVSKPKEILNEAQRAERARKRAERIIEWEKENAPSVKELNRARSYVKGFDNLSPEKRQSIMRMLRSAQGVDEKIVKGVANLMAIKAGADLEVRFDDKVKEYGLTATIGDKTLILVGTAADFKKTIKGTVAHELVHYLEKKPGYKTFADYVLKTVKPEAKAKVEKDIAKRYNEHYRAEYTAEYAKRGMKGAELESAVNAALKSEEHKALIDSEVTAELVGKALNNDKFLSRYARIGNTDGFIKKAWSFLRSMVKELKSKEENELAEILMPTIKSMDRLLQMPTVKDSESGKRYAIGSNSGYDYTKPFYQQVEDYKNGLFPKDDSLLLGETPEVFKSIGFNSLPMTINQRHVDYALNGTKDVDHEIGEILLKYLPTALKNPVAIIISSTKKNTSVVAIISITHKGSQINVPIYVDGTGTLNGIEIDSNAITSVYAKSNAITKLLNNALNEELNGNIGIYYWDKKRAVALLSGKKVPMPNTLNALSDGSIHSIRENASPVKPKFENVTESQQFKRWFGDWQNYPQNASKMVNPDGTPKVFYHGTNQGDFNEFLWEKTQRADGGFFGRGHYFTASRSMAELYGHRIVEAYLSAKNPFIWSEQIDTLNGNRGSNIIASNLIKRINMARVFPSLFADKKIASAVYNSDTGEYVDASVKWSEIQSKIEETEKTMHLQQFADGTYQWFAPGRFWDDSVGDRYSSVEKAEADKFSAAAIAFSNKYQGVAQSMSFDDQSTYTQQYGDEITKLLISMNYDASMQNPEGDEVVVFDSTQIKSATDNIGTFDKNNRDIRYSLAAKESMTNAKEAASEKKADVAKAEDDKVTELENKMRKMRERMARERAEYAKVEGAQVFAKKDVEIAVKSIEGWTQEEVLSLAKGQELQGMSRAKREEMISQIYIALHEEGSKGRVGTGYVAVKGLATKIADEYLDSAQIKGEDGKSIHLSDIYDAETIEGFKKSLTDLLFGEFAHMGQTTQNAEFQAIIRAQKESFFMDQVSDKLEAKEARNLSYQGKKLRDLVEHQKRDGAAEDIALVTKVLASVVDAKGNIRVNAVDKAMGEAARFFEGEKMKIESEKNALKTEDGKETQALSDFAWTVNDELKYMIDEYMRLRKGREGKGLTAEEMKLAADVLRAMKVTIERYNKEYIDGHWVDVEAAAKDCVTDLTADWRKTEYKNKVTAALGKAVGGIKENYFYKILTPETVVETIEGFAKNGVLKRLYHSIRVHKQKAEHLAVQMKKPLAEFIDSKEHRYTDDKGISHSFRTKLNKKMISVDGANGVADLTLGEAIYLYMLTKREPAHAGLLEEGYIVFNEKNQKRARLKLTDIEITQNNIYNQLDATDIEFLKMAESFFNETASKIKYDADMNIFGYTNIQDGYYVPMIRDRYGMMKGVTDARQSIGSIVTVYNKSFNQNLVENAKALEGKNIMSIINDHADGLADYAELYLPLKAFDRTYNRAVMTNDGLRSIREVLNNDIWSGTEKYFKDLFADIQGQREKRDDPLNNVVGKIRSAWVNSVLGANVKVIATQTTSLVAATQVIGAKYITKCSYLASPGKLPGLDEIRERAYKYSDIIEARNFDMGALKAQGNIDKVNKIGELSGWGIGWMDERICLAIFHAAELQVQDQKGFAVGSEENARLAAKLADEAIYTTQSMSSASERSAWQRSDSEIMKMLTMFTSDTVKNLSHFFGNINKWNAYRMRNNASDGAYEAEMKQAGKDVRRSIRTLAATGIMLGLIAQAFKYIYGKEEEEPEDKQKDFYKDIAGSTLNILPGVSDVIDKLVFNYDMSINVIDVANDTIESVGAAFKTAGKSMSGEYVSGNEIIKNGVGVVRSGLTLLGIPVSPVEKLATGLLRFASPEAAYGYNNIFENPSYTADLKKAVESGDADLAEYVLEKLYESELSGVYTSAELEEIVRLYSLTDEKGKHYNVLPQRVPEKLDDDTKMSAAQRKQFNKIYSQSSAKVNELIRSDYYAALDDKAKAKAISNIYGLYFDSAKAQVMGKDWSANVAYSHLTGNVTALMASKAYKSGIEEYKNERGKTVTVKEQFAEYLKGLELSKEDQLIIAYANGYKGKATTKSVLKYINSLGLPAETLKQIAKALNLEVKDGAVVEKTE